MSIAIGNTAVAAAITAAAMTIGISAAAAAAEGCVCRERECKDDAGGVLICRRRVPWQLIQWAACLLSSPTASCCCPGCAGSGSLHTVLQPT